MNSETQLLQCPFCGEKLEILGKDRYYAHKLNGCILQHFCFETDDKESIERWNIRKPIPEKITVDELDGRLKEGDRD